MKKYKQLILSTLFVMGFLCAISCKPDTVTPVADNNAIKLEQDFTDAIQLKVGNYWIYSNAPVHPDSFKITNANRDSVWIEKDSVVGSRTYYKRMGHHPDYEWLYDSAGCLVVLPDTRGTARMVLFSGNNYADTLMKNSSGFYAKMRDRGAVTNCYIFGNLRTVNYEVRQKPQQLDAYNNDNDTYIHNKYAKGIGLVQVEGRYYGGPGIVSRILVAYKVQ